MALQCQLVPVENGSVCLRVEGDATIESARDLKQALLDGLGAATRLEVDCEQVARFDLTALQLLCACHRQAITEGKTVLLKGRRGRQLRDIAGDAGFLRCASCHHSSSPRNCLWCVDDFAELG